MTRAIHALLSIMNDSDAWLGRRIEAADSLLSFEAPPEYVEAAKVFLTAVFEEPNLDDDIRMKALKLMRKVEARKVAPPTTATHDERSQRELRRRVQRARRRLALIQAGLWPAPAGWDADLSADDCQPPMSAVDERASTAERLKEARLHNAPPRNDK